MPPGCLRGVEQTRAVRQPAAKRRDCQTQGRFGMTVFGTSRSRVCKDHALIAPDSFVPSSLPGWQKTQALVVIAPPLGARFSQYLALIEPGGGTSSPLAGVQRLLYVLEGEVSLKLRQE